MTQYYKPNILVVDDDTDTLKLIGVLFQQSGYEAATASNWDEIEQKIINIEKLKRRFDVVVLDIMMPNLSGFDIYEKLKIKLNPMPQVIILSARSNMEDMVKASDLGAVKYLVKPTKPEKLLEAVRIALSRYR
jgi:DNA-binding response OmpR family regulator